MDPGAIVLFPQCQTGIVDTMAFCHMPRSARSQGCPKVILHRVLELLLCRMEGLEVLVAPMPVWVSLFRELPVRSLQLGSRRGAAGTVAPGCQTTSLCLFMGMCLPKDLVSCPPLSEINE